MFVSSAIRALMGVATATLLVAGAAEAQSTSTSREGALATTTVAASARVGHTVRRISVPGSLGETRAVDVHLWYPADQRGLSAAPTTFYTSTLNGVPLVPGRWDPLSWTIEAEIAREDVPIDPQGKAFPVIVFSHGSVNDPIDYAYTLELIAGEGFVVAAPAHVNNTQDDVRIDFVNTEALKLGVAPPLKCNGDVPSPCSTPNVPRSMADRVRDIRYVLDALDPSGESSWFGDRVDISRVGVMGHSRGTATALAAAGGSAAWSKDLNCQPSQPGQPNGGLCWNVSAEPRVKAVMGLAIAAPRITFAADLADISVPVLLVAGTRDQTSPQAVSESAFAQITTSEEKAFVSIENATHRTFDSTYCAQMQAAGAIAQANARAILDTHTLVGVLASPPGGTSGLGRDYCSFGSFTDPVDIRPLVASLTGFDVTAANVPLSGLETEEVKQGVKELAVAFFGTVLKRVGNDGPHFTRYLAPKWLERHEPMVAWADAFGSADAICPPGQDVVCED